MASPCNGKVEWVTWEVVSGPDGAPLWRKRNVRGNAPDNPGVSDAAANRMIRDQANSDADDWSEDPVRCPTDDECTQGPEVTEDTPFDIRTYAPPNNYSGTDANGNAWSARYQASSDVKFKKTRHSRECRPERSGEMFGFIPPKGDLVLTPKVLASLDLNTRIRVVEAAEAPTMRRRKKTHPTKRR